MLTGGVSRAAGGGTESQNEAPREVAWWQQPSPASRLIFVASLQMSGLLAFQLTVCLDTSCYTIEKLYFQKHF